MTTHLMHDGKTFETQGALAEHCGVNQNTLSTRLRNGLTLNEAIEPGCSKRVVVYNKTEYPTIRALATEYGITYTAILRLLNRGMTIDEAMTDLRNPHCLNFNGKPYENLNTLCVERGIEYPVVVKRLSFGMSLEEALEAPLRNYTSTNVYKYRGTSYSTQRELAQAHNIALVFLKTHLKLGLPTDVTMDSILDFFEPYMATNPEAVIYRVPYGIVDGEWIFTSDEFYEKIGLSFNQMRNYKRMNGISSKVPLHDVLERISTDKYYKGFHYDPARVVPLKNNWYHHIESIKETYNVSN